MTAQGWTPGSLLGNGNTSYGEHLTAGSAGHIRVILKDDNLGLGAKPKSKREDEPTGLDAFQDLLGRLNGKSEGQIRTEQRRREDVKLMGYVARRWGTMRFVRGGLLVQEEMPESTKVEREEDEKVEKKKRKKEKKEKDETSDSDKAKKKEKKEKKEKKKKKSKDRKNESESDESDKKSKKRKRKEKEDKSEDEPAKEPSPETAKPASTAGLIVTKERRPMGRGIIRSRNIMQKKRALMDDKSLNEVRSLLLLQDHC